MDAVAAKTIVVCVVIALMQDPDFIRKHHRLYVCPSSTLIPLNFLCLLHCNVVCTNILIIRYCEIISHRMSICVLLLVQRICFCSS
jgi:hypothetical protein